VVLCGYTCYIKCSMGKNNVSTSVDDDTLNRVGDFKNDQGIDSKSAALRKLLNEGLRSAGYPPNYQESSQRWLSLARGMASVLGLTALALLGIGTQLPVFSDYGLQLAVMSIAFLTGAEIADRHGAAIYDWLTTAAKNEADEWTASGDGGGE
jgi:hypothetical protein